MFSRLPLVLIFLVPLLGFGADTYVPRDTQKEGTPPKPQSALEKITVPEGFEVTLFAGDPDIRQPIGMCFDNRGRLWVAESYSYKEWGKRGEDRVVIFEDTDHDGRFDERTIYPRAFHHLTSVAVGFGGVWVLDSPELLFIPDADLEDGKTDGPAQTILDGWTTRAGHNFVNGLEWGPDGWLYGRHGITAPSFVGAPGTPKAERKHLDCCIWRIHPERGAASFEVVVEGTTNPWGFDWNAEGEMFMSGNVNGHLWHIVPGSRYKRMHGSGFHPHAYELQNQCADHLHHEGAWTERKRAVATADQLGGGHSHCGLMIYQGRNWPAAFRGDAFLCNTHGRRINRDALVRKGPGYTATHGKDFFKANQPWFRGTALKSGPDGAVYVLDWTDEGECHDNDGVHRRSGRIYKISYTKNGPPRQLREADLATWPVQDLATAAMNKEEWVVRRARLLLQERAGEPEVTAMWNGLLDHYTAAATDGSSIAATGTRLRLLWAMAAIGAPEFDRSFLVRQLADPNPHIRVWALRFLRDRGEKLGSALTAFASIEQDGLVKRHLAGALQQLPPAQRWDALRSLLAAPVAEHGEDLELQLWYAFEPCVAAEPERALAMLAAGSEQIAAERIRRFTSRRLSNTHQSEILAIAATYNAPELVRGLAEGLKGRRALPLPGNWNGLQSKWAEDDPMAAALASLAVVYQAKENRAALEQRLANRGLPIAERVDAMRKLAEDPGKDFRKRIGGLLKEKQLKPHVIDLLCTRKNWASLVVRELVSGKITPGEISAFQARQLVNHGYGEKIEQHWGRVRLSPKAKQDEIAAWQKKLTPELLAKSDHAAGKKVYGSLCAACHKLGGEGGNLGPELDGANRGDLYYLLENMIDPSAILPRDYRMCSVEMKDGRVFSGSRAGENEHVLTIKSPDKTHALEKKDIAQTKDLEISTMPEGLLETLSETEVRDLIHFLMK